MIWNGDENEAGDFQAFSPGRLRELGNKLQNHVDRELDVSIPVEAGGPRRRGVRRAADPVFVNNEERPRNVCLVL